MIILILMHGFETQKDQKIYPVSTSKHEYKTDIMAIMKDWEYLGNTFMKLLQSVRT